jgi:hypothetical protein
MARKYGGKGLETMSVSLDDPKDEAKALAFLHGQGATFQNLLIRTGASQESIVALNLKGGSIPQYKIYDGPASCGSSSSTIRSRTSRSRRTISRSQFRSFSRRSEGGGRAAKARDRRWAASPRNVAPQLFQPRLGARVARRPPIAAGRERSSRPHFRAVRNAGPLELALGEKAQQEHLEPLADLGEVVFAALLDAFGPRPRAVSPQAWWAR